MKFSHLLHQRDALLRHAHLCNLAFACHRLGDFAARIARARLRGEVRVRRADPAGGRPWPELLAPNGSRSVVEEHFLEEELGELADILVFLGEDDPATEFTFRFEELESRFIPALRRELEQAGVSLEHETPRIEDSTSDHGGR